MKNIYKILIILLIMLGIIAIGIENNYSINTTITTNNENVEEGQEVQTEKNETNKGLGLIAAALSTGLACLGAGIAVAIVASSAVGAISEDSSLLGKTIIFVGLAEGIAIYGLIISIMILNQI